MKPPRITRNQAVFIIVFLAGAVFANSLLGEFVYDDTPGIVNNVALRSLKFLPKFFTGGLWSFTELRAKDDFLYRPLSLIFGFISYQVWGANPFGYHLVGLLLHALNSALVFFLIRRVLVTEDSLSPFLAAVLFAVHPVHTEAVSWIGGGVDLLLTFFFLSSFLCYLSYVESQRPRILALSLLLFMFSLLTKEVAIVFPLVILACDVIIRRRVNPAPIAVFGVMGAVYFVARGMILGKTLGTLRFSLDGAGHVALFIAEALKLTILPWPLGVYPMPPRSGLFVILVAVIMLGVFLVLSVKSRACLFSSFWFFVTLGPPLLLAFHSRPIFAERFLYLPTAGLAILLAFALSVLLRKKAGLALAAVVAVTMVFGAATVFAGATWRNDGVFYGRMIKRFPSFAGGYFGLAMYYERKGAIDQSIAAYLNALDRSVTVEDKLSAYDNLGRLCGISGDYDRSIEFYKQALLLEPFNSGSLVGLGNNYWAKKDYQSALRYYEEALAADSENYVAAHNLALLHDQIGNRDKAAFYSAIASRLKKAD